MPNLTDNCRTVNLKWVIGRPFHEHYCTVNFLTDKFSRRSTSVYPEQNSCVFFPLLTHLSPTLLISTTPSLLAQGIKPKVRLSSASPRRPLIRSPCDCQVLSAVFSAHALGVSAPLILLYHHCPRSLSLSLSFFYLKFIGMTIVSKVT